MIRSAQVGLTRFSWAQRQGQVTNSSASFCVLVFSTSTGWRNRGIGLREGERSKMYSWLKSSLWKKNETHRERTPSTLEDEEDFYGVTDQLTQFIKSLTVDTIKNYNLPEEELNGEALATSGGIQLDLSDWQQRHATLVLSKVKELSRLRYLLCPRHLKERDFWRIYFSLVKSFVMEYELQAIRLEKLKKMAIEDDSDCKSLQTNGIELEMSGPK